MQALRPNTQLDMSSAVMTPPPHDLQGMQPFDQHPSIAQFCQRPKASNITTPPPQLTSQPVTVADVIRLMQHTKSTQVTQLTVQNSQRTIQPQPVQHAFATQQGASSGDTNNSNHSARNLDPNHNHTTAANTCSTRRDQQTTAGAHDADQYLLTAASTNSVSQPQWPMPR